MLALLNFLAVMVLLDMIVVTVLAALGVGGMWFWTFALGFIVAANVVLYVLRPRIRRIRDKLSSERE